MPLNNHSRTPHSPSPIYGIRPGFTVGDLEASYVTPLHIYGVYSVPLTTTGLPEDNTWNPQTGRWNPLDMLITQDTISDSVGTIVSPHARAVKISVNVTGTGNVTIVVKSAVDSYTATIATYTALSATNGWKGTGHNEFYLGGWSSPSSDGSSYQATQYGPNTVVASGEEIQGAQEESFTNLSSATDNNYVGQTYNPFQFLSLDGYALTFYSTVTGTVGYDVNVTAIS